MRSIIISEMFVGPIMGSSGASPSGWEQQETIQLIFLGGLPKALVQGACVRREGASREHSYWCPSPDLFWQRGPTQVRDAGGFI